MFGRNSSGRFLRGQALKSRLGSSSELFSIPLIEFQNLLGHSFGVLCFGSGTWSNVILIFQSVEKMRKEYFLEFGITKSLRKGGERKWKKAK